jgi:hypothetical protein
MPAERMPNKRRKNAGQKLDKTRMKPGQAPNASRTDDPLSAPHHL